MAQRKNYSIGDAIDTFCYIWGHSYLSDLSDNENESNESLDSIPGNALIPSSSTRILMSIHLMMTTVTMIMIM